MYCICITFFNQNRASLLNFTTGAICSTIQYLNIPSEPCHLKKTQSCCSKQPPALAAAQADDADGNRFLLGSDTTGVISPSASKIKYSSRGTGWLSLPPPSSTSTSRLMSRELAAAAVVLVCAAPLACSKSAGTAVPVSETGDATSSTSGFIARFFSHMARRAHLGHWLDACGISSTRKRSKMKKVGFILKKLMESAAAVGSPDILPW